MKITRLRQFAAGTALLCLLTMTFGCGSDATAPLVPVDVVELPSAADDVPKGPPYFEDVTAAPLTQFAYNNGESKGHLAILESLGNGVGLIDFDGDGDLDLFFPGGGDYAMSEKQLIAHEEELKRKNGGKLDKMPGCRIYGYPCKLYRNNGNFKFEDVSDQVLKIDGEWFYSHGCAVADYDRDGYQDLVVTGWQRVALFHNEPVDPAHPAKERKLVDVSKKAGVTPNSWSSSAGFGDLDGDGYPELYLCCYGTWGWQNHPRNCTYRDGVRDVCAPRVFAGLTDKLYRNDGASGTFTDVSDTVRRVVYNAETKKTEPAKDKETGKEIRGLQRGAQEESKALGVLFVDVNGDNKPDVYVANDTVRNYLYVNHSVPGEIRLEEAANEANVSRDGNNTPNGSMGLDAGDYDGSGRASIFVTNYEGEQMALYQNRTEPENPSKRLYFLHRSRAAGINIADLVYVGWGAGFIDLENRGDLDLLYVNGHAINTTARRDGKRLQKPVLFRSTGDGHFRFYSPRGGDYFQKGHLARGLALGDLNGDGRMDAVVAEMNHHPAVLKNVVANDHHWLGVELVGVDHADVVGARIKLVRSDGKTLYRFAKGGGSYASAPDWRKVFGLGNAAVKSVTVEWPTGKTQELTDLKMDSYNKIRQE